VQEQKEEVGNEGWVGEAFVLLFYSTKYLSYSFSYLGFGMNAFY